MSNIWGNKETVRDFFSGGGGSGSKITADGDCSHEIKRNLLLGWKAMTNLDSILKSWDITLLTKVHLVKAMVFPVVMYRFTYRVGLYYTYIELNSKESWALKNWYFWAVVLEKTLENPLDCKEIQPVHPKGNQSWNIHWKDWCWSWSFSTLATRCEELTHLKISRCWERSKVGGEGDNRGWDGWMASPTQWTRHWVKSSSWWWTGKPCMLQSMVLQRVGHHWATELNWMDLYRLHF